MNKKAYISPASEAVIFGIDCPILAGGDSTLNVHDEGGSTINGKDSYSQQADWDDFEDWDEE